MDFSDLNDVEDEETDLIVDYVYYASSRWAKTLTPHYACLDCSIRRSAIKKRVSASCCSKDSGTNYYTNNKSQWQMHLNMHLQRGDVFPQEFFELELPVE